MTRILKEKLIKNEEGNEALGFIIVALVTVIVGSTLLTVFNSGASELFTGMLKKIKTTFSV